MYRSFLLLSLLQLIFEVDTTGIIVQQESSKSSYFLRRTSSERQHIEAKSPCRPCGGSCSSIYPPHASSRIQQPRLRLRGGMGLMGTTEPDNVEKYDGNPFHCRCIGGCTCPHCMKRTKRDILLQYDGLPHHETNQPSKRDFHVN